MARASARCFRVSATSSTPWSVEPDAVASNTCGSPVERSKTTECSGIPEKVIPFLVWASALCVGMNQTMARPGFSTNPMTLLLGATSIKPPIGRAAPWAAADGLRT